MIVRMVEAGFTSGPAVMIWLHILLPIYVDKFTLDLK